MSSGHPLTPEVKAHTRRELVVNSHNKGSVQDWRTQSGGVVHDSDNVHTVKFNGWYRANNPNQHADDFDSSSNPKVLGHMTVKWGRGNNAVYSDYRGGGDKGIVSLPPGVIDKRNDKELTEYPYKALDARRHTPSEHAKELVGRINNTNDIFRHNARMAMRVAVSTSEFTQLNQTLRVMEEQGNYGLLKEMDGRDGQRMARCMSPIEVLAGIKDPSFTFSDTAVNPHDYMQEFAAHFPESTSRLQYRGYSGKRVIGSEGQRQRIDVGKKRSNRPIINTNGGYR